MMSTRLRYYSRIFSVYSDRKNSPLSFWHEQPAINLKAFEPGSDLYYMTFRDKAGYKGPFDEKGIPLLDYRGDIGKQYNPIAVAQYGLGCFNSYRETGEETFRDRFIAVSDWLVSRLEPNSRGVDVWMHHFDWPYFQELKSPWYSGLAQGQGLSVLARAFSLTNDRKYLDAAERAFVSLVTDIRDGGTRYIDQDGAWWIEEYITDPPTHILNGFIWALWGVRDFGRVGGENIQHPTSNIQRPSGEGGRVREGEGEGENGREGEWESGEWSDERAKELWNEGVKTIRNNLTRYDSGYWSLYDLAPVKKKNIASLFYHRLHIVQMEVMYRLTEVEGFRSIQHEWHSNRCCIFCRLRAFISKVIFKLTCY